MFTRRITRPAIPRATWPRTTAMLLLAGFALATAGCQPQMREQPSYRPLEKTTFYPDGRIARHAPEGTVAQDGLCLDSEFCEGKTRFTPDGPTLQAVFANTDRVPVEPTLDEISAIPYVEQIPVETTDELRQRGQQRYAIYCGLCHDAQGTGDGIVVQRGYTKPPSLLDSRLEQMPDGYFFDVITDGLGRMPDYFAEIPREDRWAIIAHIRALQGQSGN